MAPLYQSKFLNDVVQMISEFGKFLRSIVTATMKIVHMSTFDKKMYSVWMSWGMLKTRFKSYGWPLQQRKLLHEMVNFVFDCKKRGKKKYEERKKKKIRCFKHVQLFILFWFSLLIHLMIQVSVHGLP